MAACARLGISHSHFLGGPDVFTRTDRDLAVWFEIYEGERCPSCGTRPNEWDPEQGGHDHAYVAKLHKCYGCAERARAEKRITKEMGAGVTPRLERNPNVR